MNQQIKSPKKIKISFDCLIPGILVVIQLVSLLVFAQFISKKNEALVEELHKLKAFEERDKSLKNLEKNFQLVEDDLEVIDTALPDKGKMVDFISQLETEASASGIQLKMTFPSRSVVTEKKGGKSLHFSLEFQATYSQMLNLIKKIEKMPQVINIDKISIQSPEGIEGKNKVILMLKCYLDPNF